MHSSRRRWYHDDKQIHDGDDDCEPDQIDEDDYSDADGDDNDVQGDHDDDDADRDDADDQERDERSATFRCTTKLPFWDFPEK